MSYPIPVDAFSLIPADNIITVGISEMKVSDDPDSVLITHALGSCIAVILWDPLRIIGGMIHYMLPESKINPQKAEHTPAMFADTGVPMLFRAMYDMGCNKSDLVVKVAGGGKLYDDNGMFSIGKRNQIVLRKMFWRSGVVTAAEDVGGSKSRTVRLHVGTGRVVVKSQTDEVEL